jgi:ankyrin repeat protein
MNMQTFIESIMNYNINTVIEFAKLNIKLDTKDYDGYELIETLVSKKYFPILKILIENNCITPDESNDTGITLLMMASSLSRVKSSDEIVKYLISIGSNIKQKSIDGFTVISMVEKRINTTSKLSTLEILQSNIEKEEINK